MTEFWSHLEHSLIFATVFNNLKNFPVIRIIFAMNQFQNMQIFNLLKNNLEKIIYFGFKIHLTYWITLVHIIGPSVLKKNALIYWMTHVHIIGSLSVKKVHLFIKWMFAYIIRSFLEKKSLIYWMALVYKSSPSSLKKIPVIYWITFILIIGSFSVWLRPRPAVKVYR